MENFGKVLLVLGLGLSVLGLATIAFGRLFPHIKPGRLPGDIVIEQSGSVVYIPIVSMLILSGLVSVLFWLVGAVRKP